SVRSAQADLDHRSDAQSRDEAHGGGEEEHGPRARAAPLGLNRDRAQTVASDLHGDRNDRQCQASDEDADRPAVEDIDPTNADEADDRHGQARAQPGLSGPLRLQRRIRVRLRPGRLGPQRPGPGGPRSAGLASERRDHRRPANTSTSRPAPSAEARLTIGMISGRGREVLRRIADSIRCQRKAAPEARTKPMTMSTIDSVARSPVEKISEVNASTAMPPPMKASAVRIQDRKVRSLARVNRGSGSSPSGKIRRAIRPRGSSVES